jgi:hypothetical protein
MPVIAIPLPCRFDVRPRRILCPQSVADAAQIPVDARRSVNSRNAGLLDHRSDGLLTPSRPGELLDVSGNTSSDRFRTRWLDETEVSIQLS